MNGRVGFRLGRERSGLGSSNRMTFPPRAFYVMSSTHKYKVKMNIWMLNSMNSIKFSGAWCLSRIDFFHFFTSLFLVYILVFMCQISADSCVLVPLSPRTLGHAVNLVRNSRWLESGDAGRINTTAHPSLTMPHASNILFILILSSSTI